METPTTERRAADVRAPGAMTRAMGAWITASERALRVALAREGRIEEERLVRGRLKVGSHETADVVVRDARFRGPLFVEKDGWELRLPAGVAARIADGGPARRIAPSSQPRTISLGPDARGKIEIEGGSLLFHLVMPPPTMPKPRLPSSVQTGLFGEVDWHFTSILIAVFSLFLGGTVMMEAADWPIAKVLEDEGLRIALTFEEPMPPPPDPAATWAQHDPAPEAEHPEAEVEPTPQPRAERARGPARSSAPRNDAPMRLTEEVRTGIALQIGSLAGESGAFADLLADGADTTDHQALFDAINGVQHANAAGTIESANTSGSDTDRGPRCSRLGSCLANTTTMAVSEGPQLAENAPGGSVDIDGFDPIDVDERFDTRVLVRRIRGKGRQIARCYEEELTRTPDLAGRVDVEVTVMPAGNVSVDIARNGTGSRRVGECIQRHLRTIRLADGPDDPAIVGFPFVFAPQR